MFAKFRLAAALSAAAVLAGAVMATPATAAAPSPALLGHFDAAVVGDGSVTLHGWAADSRTPTTPVNVRFVITDVAGTVLEDGNWRASAVRPDVAVAYPALGSAHGFDVPLFEPPGSSGTACLSVVDPQLGPATPIGCAVYTVPKEISATGHLDSVTFVGNGHVRVRGWAFDPNATRLPVTVGIYLGGPFGQAFAARGVTANTSRPDVAAVFGVDSLHGFDVTLPTRSGSYPVCVYANDLNMFAAPTWIGCLTVTV